MTKKGVTIPGTKIYKLTKLIEKAAGSIAEGNPQTVETN
jgi:hypothetical protein